ncbi:sensor histidine kinase [Clostridium sp. UBA4548]|uniref:sensor histidine kinase n=1 Tax=Clostridium sp. UBA4548 TaxID=1946361 RepID=UPI0025B89539|nr:HAMP domain-containing sensor histidine kinase [Clostridium sp. UBA4548]
MKKDNELKTLIKEAILGVFKILMNLIGLLPKLFVKGLQYINDRLRFSISFKITTFYVFIFSTLLILSNAMVVGGFLYFIHQHSTNIAADGSKVYISFIQNTVEVSPYIGIILAITIISDIVLLLILIPIGGRVSKKLLLPVKKMNETIENISAQDLNTRLNVSGSKDELKDLAKTFNDMLDRLQRTYEAQNQFVSDASHELRTPIAVIQGYANLLDRWGKEDKEVLDEAIGAIKSEAEAMKTLVEQLLFLARSDKHTQKVEMVDFKVNELIGEVIKETKLIAPNHEILNMHNEEISINGDRSLLKEALRVFIDNSIKYTEEQGTIKINSYVKEKKLVLEVEDTGAGISKEDLPFIFDRFYRADKSRTKESGGTGLGLSIAKWIIIKHKGKIEVQSKLGHGTKITILLPLKEDNSQ